jgi:hypothetical protein
MAALDDFVTTPPTCIFCSSRVGPFDPEDVFPKWFRKALPVSTVVHSSGPGLARTPKPTNVLTLKLRRAVCKTCNNVWMSQLEERVKDLIALPMVGQADMSMNRVEQEELARWAAQKALLIQLAMAQHGLRHEYDYVTHEHLKWLYDHRETRELPPGSRVWLFVHEMGKHKTPSGVLPTVSLHRGVAFIDPEDAPIADPDVAGVLYTFTIAFLGFQVLLGSFSGETPQIVPPAPPPLLRQFLRRIGPVMNPRVTWPYRAIVDRYDDFVTISQWDVAFGSTPEEAKERAVRLIEAARNPPPEAPR